MENKKNVIQVERVAIRFAGDSGDGMQITGTQFTHETALMGNDLVTLTDYPAEIRAPAGSISGVSGFQIAFGSQRVFTPGDALDALVAMNPAALKANVKDVKPNGIIIVNVDAFEQRNLEKADYKANPLEDGSLSGYQVYPLSITNNTVQALQGLNLRTSEVTRCKNFYALGVVSWLYGREIEPATEWILKKFSHQPDIAQGNAKALEAGYNFGDNAELFASQYKVAPAKLPAGTYRNVTGSMALSYGLMAAANRADLQLIYGSYPITPASELLQMLSGFKSNDVITFQAEDEIAAICFAIGASFAGALTATGTSGPGLSLKIEAMGLAVMAELPLVIVNMQRSGPSTGLPTKTEQSDLLQALYGRHGDAPVPVLAAKSPADCFECAFEAARIAVKYMTPVIVLGDTYIANGTEPWQVVEIAKLPKIPTTKVTKCEGKFLPYQRNQDLSRPWAVPGTPGLEHRVGGLEKNEIGKVSHDPLNHELMTKYRAQKVANVAKEIPPTVIDGDKTGELLVIGWGSTYGTIRAAVDTLRKQGTKVSVVYLRYLNPLPPDLRQVVAGFKQVLIPEINDGQLHKVLRAELMIDSIPFNKIQGIPFKERDIVAAIEQQLKH